MLNKRNSDNKVIGNHIDYNVVSVMGKESQYTPLRNNYKNMVVSKSQNFNNQGQNNEYIHGAVDNVSSGAKFVKDKSIKFAFSIIICSLNLLKCEGQ